MSQLSRFLMLATVAMIAAARPGLALDTADEYVFVPNRGSADVAVIDTRTDRVVARVPVGRVPHQVAVSDVVDKLVASNTADDTISIVDLPTLATRTLRLDHEPEHMELSPEWCVARGRQHRRRHRFAGLARGGARGRPHRRPVRAAQSDLQPGWLAALRRQSRRQPCQRDRCRARRDRRRDQGRRTAARSPAKTIRARSSRASSTSPPTPDGRLGFAAHGEANELAVIDLRTRALKKRVALGELPWRAYTTADGRFMLVPNNGDRTLSVISTSTLEVVATLPAAEDVTGVNTGWFETTAFALSRAERKAVVYDLESMTRAGEIALPGTPETGVTTPDGAKLYVALSDTDQVAVIDVRTRDADQDHRRRRRRAVGHDDDRHAQLLSLTATQTTVLRGGLATRLRPALQGLALAALISALSWTAPAAELEGAGALGIDLSFAPFFGRAPSGTILQRDTPPDQRRNPLGDYRELDRADGGPGRRPTPGPSRPVRTQGGLRAECRAARRRGARARSPAQPGRRAQSHAAHRRPLHRAGAGRSAAGQGRSGARVGDPGAVRRDLARPDHRPGRSRHDQQRRGAGRAAAPARRRDRARRAHLGQGLCAAGRGGRSRTGAP